MNTKEKVPTAHNIDEYLASCLPEVTEVLQRLRLLIKETEPRVVESISYRIPAFSLHGPLVFFAAFPNHLGFYVVDKTIIKKFEQELKPFKTSGTTIHFSVENPLPDSLVIDIVKMRVGDNERREQERQDGSGI